MIADGTEIKQIEPPKIIEVLVEKVSPFYYKTCDESEREKFDEK